MLPVLPRVMLWSELKTMDEFFRLDHVNEEFFDVFVSLREEPFGVQMDAVKVFNEVYYQATRMVYEHPSPSDLPKYITEIKANLGWNYSAELVMSILYFMFLLTIEKERYVNSDFKITIAGQFKNCLYWASFKKCYLKLRRKKTYITYRFRPRPVSLKELDNKHIDWQVITNSYDSDAIHKIKDLWTDKREQVMVMFMIISRVNSESQYYYNKFIEKESIGRFGQGYDRVEASVLEQAINVFDFLYNGKDSLPSDFAKDFQLQILKRENATLKETNRNLKAEIERQNALLEKNKQSGTSRKFTLVQIVEYCKNCVDWKDVKSIVAMLNKLLRREAIAEDSDLVDSIETEFKNRKYGNIFNGAQVTMQNPQIQDVYRITGNDTVNMGEMEDGEEE